MNRFDNYSREELIRKIEELEARQIPESAEESELRFREKYAYKILDSVPDMLTVLTRDGVIVDLVSSEETNHVGVKSDVLIGSNIKDLLTPQASRNVGDNLENVFATGCTSSSHHDITLDGHMRNYENRIMPLDKDFALCMCRDVTEQQGAKRELEMVKYALNNVDEEIYACRIDGTMEYANELFRLHHDVQGDITKRKIYEFWNFNANFDHWEERLNKIREDNGSHKYTLRFKDDSGRIVVWDIMSYLIFDLFTQHEVVWFFGRDVTQRIEHEYKVKEMNSIMESILNNVPVYLFVKDPGNEFRYVYWNRAFEEFSHIPASKALGHTDFEIFPDPKDAEKFRKDDLALLRAGENISFIEEYVAANGESRIVNTSKSLVPVENKLPLVIGVSWDITDQKNAETEVIEARIRAEESDRLKSAFLANMSHEIRTPLNAIVGFAKLIGTAETEEEKQQYAEIIDTNSEVLLQLINDILDLSKIESGTISFNYKQFDLNELCRSEYETLKDRTKPGVELVFEQKYSDVQIVCDQNRLAQVITNLVNNASKFTEQGHIRFGFDVNGGQVDFYVQDTGVGIPDDKIHNIFARFIKLNEFVAGTGLGLAISKMIVERMDGTIGVESQEGVGTRFYFSIPMIHREQIRECELEREDNPQFNKANWTLLVAEESDANFRLIEAVLSRRYRLLRAYTGAEAVKVYEELRPDAILMDVRLSVMDGLEATRRIRMISPDIPVIAMSAYAFSNEIEAARAAGCNDFLLKPLSQYALRKALNACLVNLKPE